jgi:hypothetical protein
MSEQQLECVGGPDDGKYLPADGVSEQESMCMVRYSAGVSHFYVTTRRDGRLVFEYAGPSPYDVVDKLRASGTVAAADIDELERQLDLQFESRKGA